MKTLYCCLGRSTECRRDLNIQQMMSHQMHFVLMDMVSVSIKLYGVIGWDDRTKTSIKFYNVFSKTFTQ